MLMTEEEKTALHIHTRTEKKGKKKKKGDVLIIRRIFCCHGVFVSTKEWEKRSRRSWEHEKRKEKESKRETYYNEKKTNRQHATICQSSRYIQISNKKKTLETNKSIFIFEFRCSKWQLISVVFFPSFSLFFSRKILVSILTVHSYHYHRCVMYFLRKNDKSKKKKRR